MKKPAIFIDAFISSPERQSLLDYNITNFAQVGWDVFVISNKMPNFSAFHNVKYFEYDSRNRLLLNRDKYNLSSQVIIYDTLYNSAGQKFNYRTCSPFHGFTNWTLLYNIRRMALTAKRFGHTHFIGCEYDIQFKDYNLLNTIFKGFGETEVSNSTMFITSPYWGIITNLYLLNVDVVLNTIPDMETEEDYDNFLIRRFGNLTSPVFEKLIKDLFVVTTDNIWLTATPIPYEVLENHTYQWNIFKAAGDDGLRLKIQYKDITMTPVNNNTGFFVRNVGDTSVYVECRTQTFERIVELHPNTWRLWDILPGEPYVEIRTSQSLVHNHNFIRFDLTHQYDATLIEDNQ